MTAKRTHLVVVLLALTAAGCQDPYSRPERPTAAPATTTPVTSRDASGARAAARIFASRWINWDWRTASKQQRALALRAGGKLAVDLRANASSARIDASLARDKPSSRGDVVTTDLRGQATSATGIVVTREQTYTAGHADLGAQHYRVYRAHLTLTNGRWEVSSWERLP
jgi:hypothetical protein